MLPVPSDKERVSVFRNEFNDYVRGVEDGVEGGVVGTVASSIIGTPVAGDTDMYRWRMSDHGIRFEQNPNEWPVIPPLEGSYRDKGGIVTPIEIVENEYGKFLSLRQKHPKGYRVLVNISGVTNGWVAGREPNTEGFSEVYFRVPEDKLNLLKQGVPSQLMLVGGVGGEPCGKGSVPCKASYEFTTVYQK